jgi:putative DNA primase/helicase
VNVEELEKILSSYALESSAVVGFDNLSGVFGGAPLDKVLTAVDDVDLRILGRTERRRTRWSAVVLASGNNVEILGDTVRRVLVCRMVSAVEKPEERAGFKHPELLRWVGKNRARLVIAGLTLLRAYRISGATCDVGTIGSFEDWSRLIPSAIVWAGGANVMMARATQDPAQDDEKRSIAVLVAGLIKLCPVVGLDAMAAPISARNIIDAIYPDRDREPHDGPPAPDGFERLREAIEQETRCQPGRKPEAIRLGKWLQRVRGRVVDGWRIERIEGPQRSVCWRAVPSGASS